MLDDDRKSIVEKMSPLERGYIALDYLQFGFSPTLEIIRDTLRSKDAIEKFLKIRQQWDTDELLRGQAFGP